MSTKHLLPILLSAVAATAAAMPARPGSVLAVQPDNTVVELSLHGDENRHWATTPDGYTLLRDSQGYWAFAELRDSRAVASAIRYTGDDRRSVVEKGIKPRLEIPAARATAATQIDGTFPSTGKRKLLMILLNYSDTKPDFTQADFDSYMNGQGHAGTGSFRDYYLENSYGKLDITTTVTRWITLPYPKSHYGSEGATEMIIEALRILDSEIDYSEYDNDGDGVLDGLAVIHQGTGSEASGSPYDIWSHSGTLSGITYDGIQVRRYTIQPEILYTATGPRRQSSIGVMCHEFGHNLGAPDFYDTDNSLSGGDYPGTGTWDLMGSGAWNGADHDGSCPAGTNMWQKIQLGWATPEILTENKEVRDMPGSTFNPVAYRFDTTIPGEYFILENRRQEGFDRYIPGHGLIVYHVDEAQISSAIGSNDVNVSSRQGIYTVCAGASTEPGSDPSTFGWVNSTAAPFPGAMNRTSFTDTTIPSTKSNSGRNSFKGLVRIAEDNDKATVDFDFVCYQAPASPVGLTATTRQGVVELSWEAPAGETPARYNVFRNNKYIATVTEPGYVDSEVGSLTELTYAVDCEYSTGVVSPYTSVAITLPGNHIATLDATSTTSGVTLTWGLDRKLSRMPDTNTATYSEVEYFYPQIEIAHHYRAEDLTVYKGYKISHIAFFPLQGPREISCRLSVYGVDKKGVRTVLSQRNVTEIGNMQWNVVKLTKSVEITGDCDIIIAVQFNAPNGSVRLLTDRATAIDGFGNLTAVNGSDFAADAKSTGNHFLYASLSEPAADQRNMPAMQSVADPRVDLAFPLGFKIYRDGLEIGTTGGRVFTDTSAAPGDHRYAVTNLYKGNNESAAVSKDVTVEASTSSVTVEKEEMMAAVACHGGIAVTPGPRSVMVANIMGVTVATVPAGAAERRVALPAGIYIVSDGVTTVKTIVKD